MEHETLLSVQHITRDYGPLRAVDDISFEVRRGEVLGFLGPNGAGKSTTMQMISGNLAPSAGRILINDIDILDQPKQAKAQLGYLAEQPPLYRELTVDEYLRYSARIHRLAKDRMTSALAHTKERCGLGEVGNRLIGNLSKGYQQRVGIAQAIIHSPDLVILDEPTVGLDPIQIREIRELIRDLGREHSVILSTHILPEVQSVCDRVQIINKGRLVLADSIEGLTRRMTASALVVHLKNAPADHELAALPGVTSVDKLGDQGFRLNYAPEHNPTEALLAQAVSLHWGLYELMPERLSLEQVFVDITTEEQDTPEVAA